MSDQTPSEEELINEYIQKLKNKEITKDQALNELMEREVISSSYDKQDIELILDFETDAS